MTAEVLPAQASVPELIWVGDGGWVARDPAVPDHDARRVIAYIEHKDHRVYVLWVRDRHDVYIYESLREALQEIAVACQHAPPPPSDSP